MTVVWPFDNPFKPGASRGRRVNASQMSKLCDQIEQSASGEYFGQRIMATYWMSMGEEATAQQCAVWDSQADRWNLFGVSGGDPVGLFFYPSREAHIEDNSLTIPASDGGTPVCATTDGRGRIVMGLTGAGSSNKYRYTTDSGTTYSVGASSASDAANVGHIIYDSFYELFIAGLSDGTIEISEDGAAWNKVFDSFPLLTANSITRLASNNRGTIVYDGTGNIGHTVNLKTFTVSDLTNTWDFLVYVGGDLKRWILLDGNGTKYYFSTDGLNWSQTGLASPAWSEEIAAAAVWGNMIIVGQGDGDEFAFSLDGSESWEFAEVIAGGTTVTSIDAGDGQFIVSDGAIDPRMSFRMPETDLKGQSWVRDFPLPSVTESYTDGVTEITPEILNGISNNIAQAADGNMYTDLGFAMSGFSFNRNGNTEHVPDAIIYDPAEGNWISIDPGVDIISTKPWSDPNEDDSSVAITVGDNGPRQQGVATDGAGTFIFAVTDEGGVSDQYIRITGSDVNTAALVTGATTALIGENPITVVWDPVNELFIGGHENGAVETSPDGADANWTLETTPNSDARTGAAVSPTGVTVIVADGETSVIKSEDGTTWTEHSLPGASPAYVVWLGAGFDKFVTCDSGAIYASADGETWSAAGLTTPTNDPDSSLETFGRMLICNGEVSLDGGATWITVPALTGNIRAGGGHLVRAPGASTDWEFFYLG